MVFIHENSQICLRAPPVVLLLIFVFLHLVVSDCFFAKSVCSHLDIGKMTAYFRH